MSELAAAPADTRPYSPGLEGVIAGETALSYIDGEHGRLIADPHDLDMELRVNGQVRQKSNTGRMSVSIPQLVAYHSPQVYSAGDIVTTGTVAGVAASTDDPFANYLKPGDVVEAEIEGLGVLRNPVVSWRDAYGSEPPTADQWV